MMRSVRSISVLATVVLLCASAAQAVAGRPPDLQRLLDTGQCPNCDLAGTDLSGMRLMSADLSGADLRDANLRKTILFRADLSGADLRGAQLEKASLGRINLSGANMEGLDLHDGRLADVAPTLLELLRLPKPAAMTGRSLMDRDRARRAAE